MNKLCEILTIAICLFALYSTIAIMFVYPPGIVGWFVYASVIFYISYAIYFIIKVQILGR